MGRIKYLGWREFEWHLNVEFRQDLYFYKRFDGAITFFGIDIEKGRKYFVLTNEIDFDRLSWSVTNFHRLKTDVCLTKNVLYYLFIRSCVSWRIFPVHVFLLLKNLVHTVKWHIILCVCVCGCALVSCYSSPMGKGVGELREANERRTEEVGKQLQRNK